MAKPKFDPNAPFEVSNDKPKFDPSAPFEETKDSSGSTFKSDIGDTLKGVGQGATLGFGDEILGGAEALKDVTLGDKKLSELGKLYRQYQQENEKSYKEAKQRSPWLTGGGELAGSLAPAILSGGLTEGASIGQLAATGAGLGGLAGLGGSEATIENNPQNLVKDAAFSGAIGGSVPVIGKGLSNAGNSIASKIGQLSQDSPLLKKLGYAFDAAKNKGQRFTGEEAGKQIENELNNTSKSITEQFLDPLKQTSQMYGQTLAEASDNGATIATDPELLKKLAAAKQLILGDAEKGSGPVNQRMVKQVFDPQTMTSTPALKEDISQVFNPNTVSFDNVVKNSMIGVPKTAPVGMSEIASSGRGGITPELEALLRKHGSQAFDPMTVTNKTQALNPLEAKQLQLGLRDLSNKGAYRDTEVINDAQKALNPAISKALPEGELNKINGVFGQARQAVEPLINKGQIDPDFQTKQISDLDVDQLAPKVNDYVKKLLQTGKDGNISGDKSRTALSDILENLKMTNEKNQIQFADPAQISKQAEDIGYKTAIRKGIYGEKTNDKLGLVGGVVDAVSGSPYRAAEFAGIAADKLENNALSNAGKNLYRASDDMLRSVADKLNQNGQAHVGEALTNALNNKSSTGKNAAIFTILQTPGYRKTVFGDGNDQAQ